jgi:predicted nucleotidyltransferase
MINRKIMDTKVINKEIILKTLDAQAAELKKFGVQRVGLFGSFSSDENTDESDIDLLVDFSKGKKTLHNLVYLGVFLEKLFGRKVDITTPQDLSKHIGPYIIKEVQYGAF